MIDFVDIAFFTSLAEIVPYGVSLLLKASAVLALTWLVSLLLRKRSAGLRHLLWSAAFGAVLILPLISVWMPPLEVDTSRFDVIVERFFTPSETAEARSVEMLSGSVEHGGELAEVPVSEAEVDGTIDSVYIRPRRAAGFALGVWLAGVAGLSLILLLHLARIQRATRNAASKAHLRELTVEIAAELEITRTPRVLVGQVEMPVTWGLVHPVVLLPAEATDWNRRRLRIVLMHELAHVRRFDYLPHLLAELTCIAYWPNPLVWIARHRLRAEQELACDDFVLRTGTASHDYAELLLDIARTVQDRRLLPGGVRMAERKGLKTRIQTILDPDVERDTVSILAFVVIVLAVAVPAFSAAALRSAETDAETSSPVDAREVDSATAADDSSSASAREDDSVTASNDGASADAREDDSASASDDGSAHDGAFTLTVEAERAELKAPMTVREDDRASGGRFVEVPDQKGYDPPEGGPGRVAFRLDVTASGAQAVWARVIGEHHNDNSFFVSVDDGEEFRWDILDPANRDPVKRWTWLPVTDRSGEPLRLEPGVHTLTFRNREDGSRLDAVFVTSNPDLIPRGRSPLPPPEASVSVPVETEEPTEIVAPMEIRADQEASGGLYLAVARGFNSRRGAPEDGRATYRIQVPETGRYVLWARAMGPDRDKDSFWIRANDGDWVRWNGIKHGRNWEWQLVHDSDDDGEIAVFPLRAGNNTLEIAYREDGARIDRIVATNNVYQHPSARDARTSGVTVSFNE